MTTKTIEKLQSEVSGIESEIAAKRAEIGRFDAMRIAAADAAETAAAEQAAGLVAGDDSRVSAAAEAEQRGQRDARNAASAAVLVAAEVGALESKLGTARAELAAALEQKRLGELREALGALGDALADHLGRVEDLATDADRRLIAQALARELGLGLAGGYIDGRTDWRSTIVAKAIGEVSAAIVAASEPRPENAQSWDGVDLGQDVGVGVLRRFEFTGPSHGMHAAAGLVTNIPAKVAEHLVTLGAVEILSDAPLSDQQIVQRSQAGTAWRANVRANAPVIVLKHPSQWPASAPPPFADRAPTSPPGGITHAVARSEALQ